MSPELILKWKNEQPQCGWTLGMLAWEDDPEWAAVNLSWGDKGTPTHTWLIPIRDLKRLIAFTENKENRDETRI